MTYSGRSSLFVGKPDEGLQELGPVPCLAIVQDLATGKIALLHCDEQWEALGIGGNYDSVLEAKTRAERAYRGISARWVETGFSEPEATEYLRKFWAEEHCSFCDRIPPDVDMMIKRNGVKICDVCVEEFHRTLEDEREQQE